MNEGEKTIQVWAEHSHRKKKSGTYEAFMTNNQIMHLFSMSTFKITKEAFQNIGKHTHLFSFQ